MRSWTINRERDYIAEPKSSGYRALHLIVKRGGYPIEVQLRTFGRTCGPTAWKRRDGSSA
jgi:ppGpp synthetase/RelA/SpoT-type nucleotidyltranferase